MADPADQANDIATAAADRSKRPVPADFAANAHLRLRTLAEMYGAGMPLVKAWLKAAGIERAKLPTHVARSVPADFLSYQNGRQAAELMAHYRVGRQIITRWLKECGVGRGDRAKAVHTPRLVATSTPKRLNGAYPAAPAPARHDGSRAGKAADFLRQFGPVHRCDEHGEFDPAGAFWRRRTSNVLTDADLIACAERNGWKPDAWRTVTPITTGELAHG